MRSIVSGFGWFAVSAITAVVAVPSASYADVIPAVSFEVSAADVVRMPLQIFTTGTLSGVGDNSGPGGGSQTSTATALYSNGDATVFGNGETVGGDAVPGSFATADVTFWTEVVGPPGEIVPLVLTGSESTGASGRAQAQAEINLDNEFTFSACADTFNSPSLCEFPEFRTVSLHISVQTGQLFFISTEIEGGASQGTGIWSANVDPMVTIDPSFANASEFSLEFSPNVPGSTATPEPSSSLLLGLLVLLGAVLWKRLTGPRANSCGGTAAVAFFVIALLATFAGGSASAGVIQVSLDTAPLSGTAGTLAFDFIDGDGIVNNSVSILDFQSDATIGPAITTGDVTGAFPGTVTLSDTQFFNELLLPVTLGSSASFEVDYTNVAGSPPDSLSFFLLDPSAINSLVTTDLSGNTLLEVDMNGSSTTAVLLPSSISAGVGISLTSGSPSPVPEPKSLALLCIAFFSMAGLRWLRGTNWKAVVKNRQAYTNVLGFLSAGLIVLSTCGIASAQDSLPSLDPDLKVSLSGIIYDRSANTFDIRATLTNISQTTLTGPFSFVLTSTTPSSVVLANATCRTPADQPVIVADFPPTGLLLGTNLAPITLQFSNPLQVAFTFTQTVLAGDECASETVLRDFSDGYPLPDDATLLPLLQLTQPILCMTTSTPSAVSLSQAMTSIQKNLDTLAGAGALESFLATSTTTPQDQLVGWATAALANQSGTGALAALLAAHQNDPQNPMHLVNAAGAATLLGMPNEALALLDAADALGGDFGSPMGISGHAVALNNRGFALSQLGQWSQAQPLLNNAISMGPLLAEAHLNLGVALLCQGDANDGEQQIRAGLRRSSTDLRYDQIFDLSAGVAPNFPMLQYPANIDQLIPYDEFYASYVPEIFQKSDDLDTQANGFAQQAAQQTLQNPPPPLTNLHLIAIAAASGKVRHELFDDQTPPLLAYLWANVEANQQAVQNLSTEAYNALGVLRQAEPFPCCDPKTGLPTAAWEAWQGRCRGQAKALLTQFLFTQGRYEQATRAFVNPWYRTLTGLAANISDPLYEQAAALNAEADLTSQFGDLALGAFNGLLPIASIRQLIVEPPEPASPPDDTPSSTIPEPCPPALWGNHLTYSVFGFGVSANCDGISASLDSPGIKKFLKLPIAFNATQSWKGDWTVFGGVKGGSGPISVTEGFYVKGDGQNITDYGSKGSFKVGVGPFNLATGGYEASFAGAPHLGIVP
jgi:tetratricopeptide (TPR) repeat protein